MNRIFGIVEALQSLTPGAQWVLNGDDYSGLQWLDEEQEKPAEETLLSEAGRLQLQWDLLEYQRLRAPEYPPIEDYIDGIVKGDQDQVDSYIAACLEVKEKYPKPE
jgi:hypothetical protein